MKVIATSYDITIFASDDKEVAHYQKDFTASDYPNNEWSVIDAECQTICSCASKEDATLIADALNKMVT